MSFRLSVTLFVLAGALLVAVSEAQYQPVWSSIDARPLPAWYDQSKFGIFIHWGIFSVPSWAPNGHAAEWFWSDWLSTGVPNQEYQAFINSTYGYQTHYADFANQFKVNLWDPVRWAQLFKQSGAEYVVLTSKHHEGWCNWPSKASWNWNSGDVGPHRDIVGELTNAVRAQGLTMGLYHSLYEWFNPLYLTDKANNWTTSTYVDSVLFPELYDIVNTYKPDVIWSDGDWDAPDTYWRSTDFLAWLYNDSPVASTVVVNDRWGIGTRNKHGGYYTGGDRYNPGQKIGHKWENCMTIDMDSWGFRRNADITRYLTPEDLVRTLVSTVAFGGNLLMNVGPGADGTLAPIFEERLVQMGQWMGINGDAIYGTTPWRVANETASDVYYTSKGAVVNAITLTWPASGELALVSPVVTGSTAVTLLGYGPVKWVPAAAGLVIAVNQINLGPASSLKWGWTFQLTGVN